MRAICETVFFRGYAECIAVQLSMAHHTTYYQDRDRNRDRDPTSKADLLALPADRQPPSPARFEHAGTITGLIQSCFSRHATKIAGKSPVQELPVDSSCDTSIQP